MSTELPAMSHAEFAAWVEVREREGWKNNAERTAAIRVQSGLWAVENNSPVPQAIAIGLAEDVMALMRARQSSDPQ